jgi:hypothetical protein
MVFKCFYLFIVENNRLLKFWTTHYFLDIWVIYFLDMISIIIDINYQIMRSDNGSHKEGCVCLIN